MTFPFHLHGSFEAQAMQHMKQTARLYQHYSHDYEYDYRQELHLPEINQQYSNSESTDSKSLLTAQVAAGPEQASMYEQEFGMEIEPYFPTPLPSPIKAQKINHRIDDILYTFKEGRYECPREGCGKLYKNRNGLKYHLVKGQCSGSFDLVGSDGALIRSPGSTKPFKPDFATDSAAYFLYKPYVCTK